jgi:hypothetical protein
LEARGHQRERQEWDRRIDVVTVVAIAERDAAERDAAERDAMERWLVQAIDAAS